MRERMEGLSKRNDLLRTTAGQCGEQRNATVDLVRGEVRKRWSLFEGLVGYPLRGLLYVYESYM